MRQELIHITQEMEQILIKLGQAFRENAYKKAATSLENLETEKKEAGNELERKNKIIDIFSKQMKTPDVKKEANPES